MACENETLVSFCTNLESRQKSPTVALLKCPVFCAQEDKARVDVFGSFASREKINLYPSFFTLLHESDPFVAHQASCFVYFSRWQFGVVVAKLR